ncbi:MAG: sensor histidine kinase [Lachnospiraceae bacterium]|jgi:two-component system sensor histidine kinase VanS
MKRSLRRRLFVIFIGLMLVTLLIIGLLNTSLLEKYYVARKTDSLGEVYEELNQLDTGNSKVTISDDFKRLCSEQNISWVVSDTQNQIIVGLSRDGEILNSRLFGYVERMDRSPSTILEQNDQYVLQKTRDSFLNTDYLEMWGVLSNDNYFIMRTPLGSIRESVSISNMFFVYVGLSMIILTGIVIWFFSKRITRPITQLTEISQRMANLDFEAKYTAGGLDEIGVLGENFNRMSYELEHTISELKSANNELQKDIEKKTQIDEMRKEFLSNVSHELKTPLALIQGYAEGLKECINDDAESRDFYCDVIIDEAGKMNQMVKKLLTLNQLEFGNDQVVMERFDLAELIQGVVQSSMLLAEQKEAEIIFSQQKPMYVWGDEFKIEEVITNYVSNALNHVDYEKRIEICCHQQENGLVRTTVFNTGDPIPEDSISHIWTKFYKVDKARTREYGGSGIGLSIVKAIMDSMHQKCGVKNYENGVEFWFELESK